MRALRSCSHLFSTTSGNRGLRQGAKRLCAASLSTRVATQPIAKCWTGQACAVVAAKVPRLVASNLARSVKMALLLRGAPLASLSLLRLPQRANRKCRARVAAVSTKRAPSLKGSPRRSWAAALMLRAASKPTMILSKLSNLK